MGDVDGLDLGDPLEGEDAFVEVTAASSKCPKSQIRIIDELGFPVPASEIELKIKRPTHGISLRKTKTVTGEPDDEGVVTVDCKPGSKIEIGFPADVVHESAPGDKTKTDSGQHFPMDFETEFASFFS